MSRIDAVVVAVPARNEERRLPGALEAIAAAAAQVAVPVTVVVAADACTDGTAQVAADRGAIVVPSSAARVGAARAAAVAAGLHVGGARPERIWVASTDADSLVPLDWLRVHLAAAEDGAVLLQGAVLPDPHELAAEHLRRWLRLHPPADAHDRVHGANLGVRGDVYLAVGGFPDVVADEDLALVRAVRAAGWPVRSTAGAPVTTSARLVGRAPHGFAEYLRERVVPGGGAPAG